MSSDGVPIDDYFTGDKLHLNNKGYSLWGEIIKASFDKRLYAKI